MKHILAIIIAIVVTLYQPLIAQAATVVTDTFDTYSNAALAGQGSWLGSGTNSGYTVQSTVAQGGTKAISAANNINGNGWVYRPFTSYSTGIVTISVYVRNTNASTYGASTWFMNGSSNLWGAYMYNDNTFKVFDGSSFNATGISWTNNTWYLLTFDADLDNNRVRVAIDGGTPSSWFTVPDSSINGVGFIIPANYTGTSYWDTLTVSDNTGTAIPTSEQVIIFE
jgi:hypothetical protein